jgi:hypothetical protein
MRNGAFGREEAPTLAPLCRGAAKLRYASR